MSEKIRIRILSDNDVTEVMEPPGISLKELAAKYYDRSAGYFPVFASVNDVGRDLLYRISRPSAVRFMDLRSRLARLVYQRSIYFLYLVALNEIDPDAVPVLKHPLNDGIYVKIENQPDSPASVQWRIEKRMRELIDEDVSFSRNIIRRKQILSENPPEIMTEEQIDYIRNCDIREVFEYSCRGFSTIFYDPLIASAQSLSLFRIVPYQGGAVIRVPQYRSTKSLPEYRDDKKLYEAFIEEAEWNRNVGVWYMKDLNRKIMEGEWHDLILLNEALQEKKVAAIADDIIRKNRRIILIAGPSSSGKTTFAQRLCIQLRVNGKRPLYMGTDDYFVERDQAPVDEFGKFNFEDLDAVDVDLFNEQMNGLLAGETVDMPVFDFIKGSKRYGTRITRAEKDQPIVIEGIHALNDQLTENIPEAEKYRIYVSPLTTLNIDGNNRIPVSDLRLVRRIARDIRSRGRTASQTLSEWVKVRAGEVKNIFPYSVTADMFFNSAFMYEWAMLKPVIKESLEEIREEDENYLEAERLLRILRCVKSLKNAEDISNNSIMREFIGGGIWVK